MGSRENILLCAFPDWLTSGLQSIYYELMSLGKNRFILTPRNKSSLRKETVSAASLMSRAEKKSFVFMEGEKNL